MSAAVDNDRFRQRIRQASEEIPQKKRMPADVGRHIHQDQTGPRPDQAVCQARKLNALQNQKLRYDVQKARHHQRKQIDSKELVPARKLDTGEAVGRERGDEYGKNDRYTGIDDAVPDRRRKDLQLQNMLIRGKVQSGRKQSGRIWQHIAEFLERIADHEEKRNREDQQRTDQQRQQQDLAQKLRPFFSFDVFQAYPSCSVLFSFSVRFRITVRITMVTAEIMPMAEASPKAN